MNAFTTATPATRLLCLPDAHGAPLADFDLYQEQDLLHISWHGHLTADAVVRGARAGMHLFANGVLPRRLLSNHQAVTGEWGEALPWLHYEWLPEASERGVRVMAHVLAHGTASQLINFPGSHEFIEAITHELRAQSFRHVEPALQWLAHR
ncbi:hypothetical protein QMK33_18260 [Hymenobacter sp. H14-R3]|uniref:hypothetical protein n=1 Tax=Hymenobacter sp. H14-R3 TaxID=3046308 RepID=UPI0024B99ADD|nr:hypothetical protein [Hymenobacter sp. H14-R3]MDJ0367098.1 hypothetical protein [Hymenobacter sp. H14-R3]